MPRSGAASRRKRARALVGEGEPIAAYLPRRQALLPATIRALAKSIAHVSPTRSRD